MSLVYKRMSLAPKWLLKQEGITQRQWKQRKRRHLRDVRRALSQYRFGCAFCPSHYLTDSIANLVSELEKSHSVQNWGR
jgi:hypothetical protein